MDTEVPSFAVAMLLGSLGALAPEIIRFHHDNERLETFSFSLRYVLCSLLYAILGGVVAASMHPSNWLSAIYSGVALPFIISAGLKNRKSQYRANDARPDLSMRFRRKNDTWYGQLISFMRDHADGLFL